jgi:hypothetical protein
MVEFLNISRCKAVMDARSGEQRHRRKKGLGGGGSKDTIVLEWQ